jgi:hypothetical protein
MLKPFRGVITWSTVTWAPLSSAREQVKGKSQSMSVRLVASRMERKGT